MGQAATRWRAGEKSVKIIVIFLSLPHQELVKKFRDAGQKKSKIRLTFRGVSGMLVAAPRYGVARKG